MGIFVPAVSTKPLTLAMMMVAQLVDRMIKRATVAVGKGKLVEQVPSLIYDLAKPPLKVLVALIQRLIPKLCL